MDLKLGPWGGEGHGGRLEGNPWQGGANVIMPCGGGLDEGEGGEAEWRKELER